MNTNLYRKNITLLLAFLLLFCFSFASVYAEDSYPIGIETKVSSYVQENGVSVGNSFYLPVSLLFDENFLTATEGIIAVQFGIRFDPTKLVPVDYETYEPIEFAESGEAINGKPYSFGFIADEARFTLMMASDRKTLVCTYFSSTDRIHDITISDLFATFAFKAVDDFEVNGSTDTVLQITNPYIAGSNSEAKIKVLSEDLKLKITAPFSVGIMGETIVGGQVSVVGRHSVDKNSGETITMRITKNGEDVEPARDIPVSSMFIDEVISFDENIYSSGAYIISFQYRNATKNLYVELKSKIVEPDPIIIPTPEPTPSTSPGETDEPEESEKPTATPSPTPSVEPTNTPAPTATPTAKPTSKPSTGVSRPAATSTPAPSAGNIDEESTATPKPSTTDKEDDGEDGSDSVQHPSDIDGHWAGNSVRYVYDNSLMNGYADGTFGPDNKITRAEFATVMARYLGLESAPDKADHFSDVKEHWAKGYIGALVEKGIVNGVSDELFAPDSTVTREQIAVILSRTLALEPVIPTDKYADDAQISSWAYDGVYSIFTAGIMKGDTSGNFSPLAGATRAEVATILYRLHSKK